MSKYLVECNCGNKLPVEMGQAGGRVTCSCGNVVDVPPLRQLRHLPQAAGEMARPTSTWNARKGLTTASLLLAGVLVIFNAVSWFTQPVVPQFDPVFYEHNVVDARLEKMTPVQGWTWWTEYYKPMAERGFSYLEFANRGIIERNIAERQSLRRTLWIFAAIAAGIALAATFWPKSPEVISRRID